MDIAVRQLQTARLTPPTFDTIVCNVEVSSNAQTPTSEGFFIRQRSFYTPDMAEEWQDTIPPGHNMFFDFQYVPELEKPVLDYLQKGFGWTLEQPFFIRKPE